jgi:hypothetical protein
MRVGDRKLSPIDVLAYLFFAALIVAMLLVPVK